MKCVVCVLHVLDSQPNGWPSRIADMTMCNALGGVCVKIWRGDLSQTQTLWTKHVRTEESSQDFDMGFKANFVLFGYQSDETF